MRTSCGLEKDVGSVELSADIPNTCLVLQANWSCKFKQSLKKHILNIAIFIIKLTPGVYTCTSLLMQHNEVYVTVLCLFDFF